ncbi:MAG: 30S ribosomal protein S9 [Parcubacteria group bacterium]|nr:30S ribosomal protein S9 [Parcubacteria group bacterium]
MVIKKQKKEKNIANAKAPASAPPSPKATDGRGKASVDKSEGKEKFKEKFYEAIGRRKTATARVRIWPNSKNKEITINDKNFSEYFKEKGMQETAVQPFEKSSSALSKMSAKVYGGGLRAQSQAIRHGLSRALVLLNPELKSILKTLGFLTRDSRMKERKKPGLKGARRAPQWSKR